MSYTTYITNKCCGDDFGSQYYYLIAILLNCYANGYTFVYNKLTHMENNYDNIERMENLMNLRPHFTPFGDESLNNAFITIYDMTIKNVIHANIDYYTSDEYMRRIKDMFWANKDAHTLFDNNGKLNVVLYLPENASVLPNDPENATVLPNDPENATVLPYDIYVNTIQTLRDQYNGNLTFHIYAQGSIDAFQCFSAEEDTIIHMNENIESTFISMVAADMLIVTNSSLSYTAALLSNGIIYYQSNINPPRNTWISL